MALRVMSALLLIGASALAAQERSADYHLKVRGTVSGSSDASESAYTIYSGVALDVALTRGIGPFAVELGLRTESREVQGPGSPGLPLGSLEMLPVTLSAQWRPRSGGEGRFQPYAGVGLVSTTTWEKSGALDSIDVPPHLGPMVQVGFDQWIRERIGLNLDVRWSRLRVDLGAFDATAPDVKVDPLALALGIAFPL